MNTIEITLSVVLGLVVNEFTDLSPWLARKLVAWSAGQHYGDTTRSEIRAEELAAVINDRPGKLFKLGTGLGFASAALLGRLRRLVTGESQPREKPLDLPSSSRILPVEDEPTPGVARYLFPTERYRGEWRRHWIHLAKRLFVIALYAVLGTWAAVERIKPQYVGWIVAAIITGAVLLAVFRVLGWYLGRFVITNKRLMSAEGVLFRRVAMMPLLRVTDMRYGQSPIGRLLGYGTFELETVSRRVSLRRIVDLPNPDELYLRLVEEMYEPAAVEARLGRDYDSSEYGDPAAYGDPLEYGDGERRISLPVLDFGAGDDDDDAQLRLPPGDPLGDLPADPLADPAVIQREIIYQIGALSTQLATLAAAIQRLSPAPPDATTTTADAAPLVAVPDDEPPSRPELRPAAGRRVFRPRRAEPLPEIGE